MSPMHLRGSRKNYWDHIDTVENIGTSVATIERFSKAHYETQKRWGPMQRA